MFAHSYRRIMKIDRLTENLSISGKSNLSDTFTFPVN